jgi:xylulokinase
MSYLGLDIGTGGCKAVVFSSDGTELCSAFREYAVLHPHPDWAELNPDEVINKCFEVIAEVNSKTTDAVVSMCISSQGEAFTPIGNDGQILGNAMVSSDSRARDLSINWSKNFGTEKIYRITGHTPHPLFTLYKILWTKENKPEIWQNTHYFLCFEDLFHFKVGLDPKISWPMAGRTMLFDVIKHEWSKEILDTVGLTAEKLATPIAPGEIAGTIDLNFGKKLGFKNPVVMVAGGHDQTCGALGAGVTEPGMCMYATGTVECFCPMLEKPSFSEDLQKNNLCCYDYTIKGQYTTVAYSLTGGNILRWMRDEFGESEIAKAEATGQNPYSILLDAMPHSPTDLLVLPYFSATGTPYFDTKAKGAIVGIQLTTTKGEITKALLEGVALEMKLNLELMEKSGMKIHTFIATGGGTRNDIWTQLKADVLNKKIMVRDVNEAGCYGAALLACKAIENKPINQLLKQQKGETKIFIPNAENARLYDKKFESYKKMYHSLKQFWES